MEGLDDFFSSSPFEQDKRISDIQQQMRILQMQIQELQNRRAVENMSNKELVTLLISVTSEVSMRLINGSLKPSDM